MDAFCGTPGKDGAGGTLGGVVNSYWQGTVNAPSGSTSLTLSARAGAANNIAVGDLLLVIQMQDGTQDSSNTSTYGDGTGIGSGSTSLGSAGLWEYAVATSALAAFPGVVNINGQGPGGGLLNSYSNADAAGVNGARRFQVIRVPQYSSATLGPTLSCLAWQGSVAPAVAWVGGILAVDVQNTLTLAGATVSVDALGFRAGQGRQLGGGAAGAGDYVSLSTINAHGRAAPLANHHDATALAALEIGRASCRERV